MNMNVLLSRFVIKIVIVAMIIPADIGMSLPVVESAVTHTLRTENKVLARNQANKKEIDIFLPTAIRFYLQELKDLNFIQKRAHCQATLNF